MHLFGRGWSAIIIGTITLLVVLEIYRNGDSPMQWWQNAVFGFIVFVIAWEIAGAFMDIWCKHHAKKTDSR